MNTDTSILVYKFRPKRTGFNMYATAINFPSIITLIVQIFEGLFLSFLKRKREKQ